MMFDTIISIFLAIQAVAILLCFLRAVLGPTMQDRVVALDTVGLILIGFVGTIMIFHNTIAYTEIIIVLGILAFIGSVAIAKYLQRGDIFDRH